METLTKIQTKAVRLAVFSAAAYSGYEAVATKGYKNLSVEYYSCASLNWTAESIPIQENHHSPVKIYKPGNPCASAKTLKNVAQNCCAGERSPETGKIGVNSFKISKRSTIIPPTQINNYGYNPQEYKKILQEFPPF